MIWALAILTATHDLELDLQYGPSCPGGWAITGVKVVGEVAPHVFDLEWTVAGDIQGDTFVEKRRIERMRWKKDDPLPCRTDLAWWAREASHPDTRAEDISCLTGAHIYTSQYGDDVLEVFRKDGAKDGAISLNGKPLTRGDIYGVFGRYLVITADGRSLLAVADIFDLRKRKKVQHVTFNRLRPIRFDGDQLRLYVATQKTCSAPAQLTLEPRAKPVFDPNGKPTCE